LVFPNGAEAGIRPKGIAMVAINARIAMILERNAQ
jgi:hypothetical protein